MVLTWPERLPLPPIATVVPSAETDNGHRITPEASAAVPSPGWEDKLGWEDGCSEGAVTGEINFLSPLPKFQPPLPYLQQKPAPQESLISKMNSPYSVADKREPLRGN